MNGIMPGPLWLAIASAVKNDSSENRFLNHCSGNDAVSEKPADTQTEIAVRGRKVTRGDERKGKGG